MNNYTFITVLSTEKYLEGTLALFESLKRTNTKYPFAVLVTDEISVQTEIKLRNFGINIIKKNKMDIPESIKEKNNNGNFSHWNNTFDKLLLFELTQFDKLVFLDSDMYVRKNIDDLFQKSHMSATIDRKYGPSINKDWIKLTSGLMVIEPKNNMLPIFIDLIGKVENEKESLGDQDILQEYYPEWEQKENLHLGVAYNLFFPHLDYYIHYNNYNLDDVKVIHFIYTKKPFFYDKEQSGQYMDYIEEVKKKNYEKYKLQYQKDCILCGNAYEKIIIEEYFSILKEVREK